MVYTGIVPGRGDGGMTPAVADNRGVTPPALSPQPVGLRAGRRHRTWSWAWLPAGLLGGLLALAPWAAAAAERVALPSLDRRAGEPVQLAGHWFPAPGAAAGAPAMLLLHGCSGLVDGRGRVGERFAEMAARLNAMGIHALAVDSLRPRGEREICTQGAGQRKVTQLQRRRDALAALQWLAQRPEVDARRVGLLGWSNGGSTVLAATNLRHPEVAATPLRPSLAAAYYPGCEAELDRGYRPSAPLLLLLGEADDWTPAAPCMALAVRGAPERGDGAAPRAPAAASASATAAAAVSAPEAATAPRPAGVPAPEWEQYAGAHHGFDGSGPLRLRRDVPGGARPGQGVHVGGDAAARAASWARLERFIREHWNIP